MSVPRPLRICRPVAYAGHEPTNTHLDIGIYPSLFCVPVTSAPMVATSIMIGLSHSLAAFLRACDTFFGALTRFEMPR